MTHMEELANAVWRELRLSPGASIDEVCAALKRQWGYYVEVHPRPMGNRAVYGTCWAAGDDIWVITVRDDAPPLQRDLTVYHEIEHIISGDVATPGSFIVRRDDILVTPNEADANAFAQAFAMLALYGEPDTALGNAIQAPGDDELPARYKAFHDKLRQ